ncbi:hypothetical protein [Bordetella sp. LUAb4]|uniref:hypothetical protein n=1 Tax=Bordetella sp. LUAb4 TaxID=2843195 RepID=UPI001E43E260|nr:hypothetical protein [Bordetella sp. LUAb4]
MNDEAAVHTQASSPTAPDYRPRRTTLTQHFAQARNFSQESLKQAGEEQRDAASKNIAMRIHWDEFSDDHPEVKDVLPGQLVAPLIARCQDTTWGRTPAVPGGNVKFVWRQNWFGLGLVSTAAPNTSTIKGFVTTGDDVLATAYGIVMQKPTGPSGFSPDYGIGYFMAYETGTLPLGPTADTDLARCAVFAVRTWFAPTVKLATESGDGQSVYRGNFFAPLTALVADSTGSLRAAEHMVITFSIISGDVTFAQSGNTARYSRISNNGKVAAVAVEGAYAIAPGLLAGSKSGACQIRASTPLAGGATLTFNVNVT